MEIVEDPTGLLTRIKGFVAGRRFAPEVWEGRRGLLLGQLHHLRDQARALFYRNAFQETCQVLQGPQGFGVTGGDLWLEAARRIYSSKEQDGLFAEVARTAGHEDAHTLYRCALGVQPERATASTATILALWEKADRLLTHLMTLPLPPQGLKDLRLIRAWANHVAGTLYLAPGRGHPAYVYQGLQEFRYWTVDLPRAAVQYCQKCGVRNTETSPETLREVEALERQLLDTLQDPTLTPDRAQLGLAAAEKFLARSEEVFSPWENKGGGSPLG